MTRSDLAKLVLGAVIERTLDCRYGQPLAKARWGFQGMITNISARGITDNGVAYVSGYTTFGASTQMSFTINEYEDYLRIVSIGAPPQQQVMI